MVDKQQIENFLKRMMTVMGDFTIHDDGVVDVDGGVSVYMDNMNRLPIRFGTTRNFTLFNAEDLETLEGCPRIVNGDFKVYDGLFEDLQGGPQIVKGDFSTTGIYFKTLEGSPQEIGGRWWLNYSDRLPLLRTIVAQGGVDISGRHYSPVKTFSEIRLIEDIMNGPWMGKGKKGSLMCAAALIKAGFEGNARW